MFARPTTALLTALLASTSLNLISAHTAHAVPAIPPAVYPAVHPMAEDASVAITLMATQDGQPVQTLNAGTQIVYQVDVANKGTEALADIKVADGSGTLTFAPKEQGQTTAEASKTISFVSAPTAVTAEQVSAGSLNLTVKVTGTRNGLPVERTSPLSLPFTPSAAAPTAVPAAATTSPTATTPAAPEPTQIPTQVPEPTQEPVENTPVPTPTRVKISAGQAAISPSPIPTIAVAGAGGAALIGGLLLVMRGLVRRQRAN